MTNQHKVFKVMREGESLIVIPQGDTSAFRYVEVHNESNALYRLLDEPDLVNLVVDLGSVPIAGSVIIESIIRLGRKVSNKGGQAALCNASDAMLEVLQTMNLEKLFPIFRSREEALQSLRSSAAD